MTKPETADLDQLYRDHYRAVLRYVVRRTGDHDRAHDIAAEVFLVAWQRRGDLPAHRPLPWLYGVAANVLAHTRRSELRAVSAYQRFGNNLVTRTDPGPGEQADWSDDRRSQRRLLCCTPSCQPVDLRKRSCCNWRPVPPGT